MLTVGGAPCVTTTEAEAVSLRSPFSTNTENSYVPVLNVFLGIVVVVLAVRVASVTRVVPSFSTHGVLSVVFTQDQVK